MTLTPEIQTLLALAIVGLAIGWLIMRTVGKRKNSCGNDCCGTGDLKSKLKR